MKKFIIWLLEHIYIRKVDLQSKPDDISPDEVEPKTATEVGIKIQW